MKIKGVVGLFLAAAFCASFSACDFAAMSKEEDGSGKSAYEIAVENGFQGSEEDWLLSLKGEDGKDGTRLQSPICTKNGWRREIRGATTNF